ncbi:DUF4145 domain-containing protein [Fodinicola acaciae]|uniref:DUF4145 domain-containing protein n=1 Tax=Fodinicola acaciae TaxID=2681555 RepID=UPI0013D710AA|nr:hypothetical protein [Fodinicola acaciae]
MNEELSALVDASPNFRFIAEPELLLAGDAALAERYVDSDPDGAMFKARHFGETLAKILVRQAAIQYPEKANQFGRVAALVNEGVIPGRLRPVFDTLRSEGNEAVHGFSGDRQKARTLVKACHRLAVWWYERQSGKPHHHPFQPPQAEESTSLRDLFEKVEEQLQSLQTVFDGAVGRPEPRIVIKTAQPDAHDWRGGSTVVCGQRSYLVHHPVQTMEADDRSWKLMQARAHSLDSHANQVWLRGLLIASGSRGQVAEMVDGLAAQASYLTDARHRNRSAAGSSLHKDGDLHVLVTALPTGSSWTEVFGPGDCPLDPLVLPRVLEVLVAVAEVLANLHRAGQGHRALDGESILVSKTGSKGALRDLGLAWWPRLTHEGRPYQAPEQQAIARGLPGPATDVFQLATLLQHACAGYRPTAGMTIALKAFISNFPERLDELLGRALDPNPSNRPDIATFAAELRLGKQHLVTEANAWP